MSPRRTSSASVAVPKYATRRNPRRRSQLEAVEAVGRRLGYPLMPWQSQVVDVATEYKVRDRIPYRKTVLVTIPRQSGKSVLVTVVAAWWLLAFPDQYAVLTAQTRIAATNRIKAIARTLTRSGLDPKLHFTRGVGNERVTLSNGSQIDVVSPTAASVHGESVDLAIIDEAWAVDPVFLAGVIPSMVARPRSQLWVISTAGTEDSELLNDMVARARENPDGDIAYTEYSMPEDAHPYETGRWGEWMPALGHTTSVASIEAARVNLSLPEFRRAFGNVAILHDNAAAIPWAWWNDSAATEPPPAGMSIAVDVNRNPPGWSIAGSWPLGGDGYHADLIAHSPSLDLSSIAGRVDELVRRFSVTSIGLDPIGPAGSLLPDFQAIADRYRIPLETFNGAERARADTYLFELLRDGRLTHSSMIALDQAVEGARAGEKGESWFFHRPSSMVDISPLLAVSMAAWCAYRHEKLAPVVAIY